MIITIDGPAGAGKSTVARLVAGRLGLRYLDTGATYRAVTWKARELGIPLEDSARVAEMIRATKIGIEGDVVRVDGRDVSAEIRANEISRAVAPVARSPECRAELVKWQREHARGGGMVTEGRDQGSMVFPDADFKFYLDAAPEERARRRAAELRGRGRQADEKKILIEISERDRSDMERAVGALRRPEGAIVIDSTGKSVDEVADEIVRLASAV